jgi:hypothetical protein
MRTTLIIFLILIFAGGIYFIYYYSQEDEIGPLDSFAECIEESGAKFYGAFWDTSTKEQKKLFGPSKRLLPYIECTASSEMYQFQSEDCKKEGIETYPTWLFKGDGYIFGVASLEKLAERTNCELPSSPI